jgi:type I restriction enzyme, S subunit
MSIPMYPAYKDSGVEWLSQVPAHWEVKPCRAVFTERSERNDPLVNEDYLSLMANVGIIPYAEKGDVGNKKPEDLTKCKLVFAGDLVINSMNYGIGSYGLSSLTGVCSPVYIVLKPKLERIEERFAFRILENKAFQGFAQSHGNGILEHRAAINWDILKGIGVPLPPVPEQQAILGFLDRETAKIDALVTEQEQLITLLKEKRQAVISHAVTKGLDPSAPMKDSGFGSLGEIPIHWEVVPIKHVGSICYGIGEPPTYHLEGVPLIRATNVDQGTLVPKGMVFVDPADIPSKRIVWLVAGDIIVVRSGAYTGDSAIIPDGYGDCIAGFDMVLRCHSANPTFVQFALLSDQLKLGQIDLMRMRAAQPHLNAEELGGVLLALPPTTDQQLEIAAFLAKALRDLEQLVNAAVLSIELLRERRSALISAAVTGQIDVRGLAPAPEPAA